MEKFGFNLQREHGKQILQQTWYFVNCFKIRHLFFPKYVGIILFINSFRNETSFPNFRFSYVCVWENLYPTRLLLTDVLINYFKFKIYFDNYVIAICYDEELIYFTLSNEKYLIEFFPKLKNGEDTPCMATIQKNQWTVKLCLFISVKLRNSVNWNVPTGQNGKKLLVIFFSVIKIFRENIKDGTTLLLFLSNRTIFNITDCLIIFPSIKLCLIYFWYNHILLPLIFHAYILSLLHFWISFSSCKYYWKFNLHCRNFYYFFCVNCLLNLSIFNNIMK